MFVPPSGPEKTPLGATLYGGETEEDLALLPPLPCLVILWTLYHEMPGLTILEATSGKEAYYPLTPHYPLNIAV